MRIKTKTAALVLRKKALPQKDYFVVLLTKEFGKVHCLAKGSRSLTSRRSPHLQTGNLLEVQLQEGPSGYMLQETSLQSAFRNVKQDLNKLNNLYIFFFVLDKLLPEGEQENQVYNLTIQYLTLLSEQKTCSVQETCEYLRRTLRILGYDFNGPPLEIISYIEELINAKVPVHDIISL